MVASTGVCETSDRRATVAIAVPYALAAAPADGAPEPPNAPLAPATATPATSTTATTAAIIQRPRPRGRPSPGFGATTVPAGSLAGLPVETVPFTIRLPARQRPAPRVACRPSRPPQP